MVGTSGFSLSETEGEGFGLLDRTAFFFSFFIELIMTSSLSSLQWECPAGGSADSGAFETVFRRGGGATEILLSSRLISVLGTDISI